MIDSQKINLIYQTITEFFCKNKDIDKILAKDLMPDFVKKGVFENDHRKGCLSETCYGSLIETAN